jgi:hypothetical protein
VSVLHTARAAEVRLDKERARLGVLSLSTLEYIFDYGLAREAELRGHHANLRFLAGEEFDLVEAMQLSERLRKVEVNVARAARWNECVRAELVCRRTAVSDR